MFKKILFLFSFILIISGCSHVDNFLVENKKIIHNQDEIKTDIILLLKNNSDAKEYLDYYSSFEIESIKYSTQIQTNLSVPISNFYKDITLNENLIEVLIIDNSTQLKLLSLINIREKYVFKVAGIYEINLD